MTDKELKKIVADAVKAAVTRHVADLALLPPGSTVEVQDLGGLIAAVSVRLPNQVRRVFTVKISEVM